MSVRATSAVLMRPEWVFDVARAVDAFVRSPGDGPAGLERLFRLLPVAEHELEHKLLDDLRHRLARLLHVPSRAASRAERARQLLIDEYHKPWTVTRLARAVGCNRTTLQEEFRLLTDTTVHRFLVERRVAAAMQLLRDSDLKASRIAIEVGYRSHSAFARHFKSVTGVTLATFRVRCTGMAAV